MKTQIILAVLWVATAPLQATANEALSEQLHQIVKRYEDGAGFMGAALVMHENEALLRDGFGMANLEHSVPNTPMTKFRIGSVSKQFTAAGILLLADWGDLNLDGAVESYLDGIAPEWSEVTIHHLLTHTAGIPNFTSFPDYSQLKMHTSTPRSLMEHWIDRPLEFSPGARFAYSNSGYVTLAAVIEELSGESWEAFLQSNITKPLGLHNTGHDSNAAIIPDRAQGYEITPEGFVNTEYINMEVPIGGGDIYSTIDDLHRWATAVYSGEFLGEELTERMLTPAKSEYGYGVFLRTHQRQPAIQHSGGIEGFVSELVHLPESSLTVVVLSNSGCPATGQIAAEMMDHVLANLAVSEE